MSNEPDSDSSDDFDEAEREARERRRSADATIAYLSGALRFFGVERVVADFHGVEGDGTVDVPAYHPPPTGDLPFGLASRIGRLWDDLLPMHWDSGDGSSGTITIVTKTGKVIIDYTYHGEEEWGEDE